MKRDMEKQARIDFRAGDIGFKNPEIKELLSLVPLAYEKMAKMPVIFHPAEQQEPSRAQIK